ncbi:hypothetical protein [Rheinheimera sp.]|uniref:hypothetical protein n=1 Tax=Rheinheimera sp. TaxID=1869214 RepID=UPI00307ED7DD
MLIKATYVPINVSAGATNDMVWANMEVCNPYTRDTGINDNVGIGSPVVKVNLIVRDTGKPNVALAKRLKEAFTRIYLQPTEFEGVMEIVKKGGVEQMTFTVFDAAIPEPKAQLKAS